jgi:prolyl-tRNA editing enzyme YbaK/EbsC (Cys-tRNA(Pro) deacylase)
MHLRVFIDPDLLQYDEVWAAEGTWHDVFGIDPTSWWKPAKVS